MTSFSDLVPIVALGSTAFVAGLLWIFSACVMPALDSIQPAQSLAAMKIINTDIVTPVFVPLFLASLGASVAAVVVSVGSLPEDGWLLAGGAIHLVGAMAVTAAVHLPLNNRFESLDESPAAVAEWQAGATRWTRFNHVRATAAILAAIAYAVHLAIS